MHCLMFTFLIKATEIWKSLNKKYILEDARTQKKFIGNFLNFIMSDEKDISS